MKLLYDLFPLLLFYVAFQFQGIYIATAVAIAATFAQMIWSQKRDGKIDLLLWINCVLISVTGGATLLVLNEAFIKWKPTILYVSFAAVLLLSDWVFRKNLMRTLLNGKLTLPSHAWKRLNMIWGFFFVVLGGINAYVVLNFSTEVWVNFDMFGFIGLMLLFITGQLLWLKKYDDEMIEIP